MYDFAPEVHFCRNFFTDREKTPKIIKKKTQQKFGVTLK